MTRRSIAATLAVAPLTMLVAVLAAPSPVHAAGSSIVVSAASVSGSPVSASAVATCPAGYNLVGAGGRLDNAGGNVVLTDVIPDVSARTVTAWGHEKGAFGGSWSVVAYAICDDVITGVVRVGVTTANNATSPKSASPECPDNKALTGLGWQLRNANGEVFPDDATPGFDLAQATLTAYANGGFAGNWQLTGYAICADVPAGAVPQIVDDVSAFDSDSPKTVTTDACPAGTRQVGVGGQMFNAVGNVVLDQVAPDAAATRTKTRGNEFGAWGGTWELYSYAICW